MTETPIAVLIKAADLGLKLKSKPPHTLTVEAADGCPQDFVPVLKAHKPALLTLLKLPFVMVQSATLGETVFFCEGEDTKGALVEAGAEPWSIYTRDELRTLCVQNRVAPLTPAELRKVHEIKRTFSGRITR